MYADYVPTRNNREAVSVKIPDLVHDKNSVWDMNKNDKDWYNINGKKSERDKPEPVIVFTWNVPTRTPIWSVDVLWSQIDWNVLHKINENNHRLLHHQSHDVLCTLIRCLQEILSKVMSPLRFKIAMSKLNWSCHVLRGLPRFHFPQSKSFQSFELRLRYAFVWHEW